MTEVFVQPHPEARIRELEMALDKSRQLATERRELDAKLVEINRRLREINRALVSGSGYLGAQKEKVEVEKQRAEFVKRVMEIETERSNLKAWIAKARERVPTGSTSALMTVKRKLGDARAWETPELVRRSRSELIDVVEAALSQGGGRS